MLSIDLAADFAVIGGSATELGVTMNFCQDLKRDCMRDYSMTGADAQRAIASGLAAAGWYHSATDRQSHESADAALRSARAAR